MSNVVKLFNLMPYFCSHGEDGEDPYKKQVQEMFNRLAGSDKEIDAAELQDILTICLKHGNKDIIMLIIFTMIILQISLTVCLILLFVVS